MGAAVTRALGIAALCVLAGCGPPGPPPGTVDEVPETAHGLLASIRERTHPFTTARCGFQLVSRDLVTGEEDRVGLSLSYAAPDRLRARGTAAAFFTAFDLVVGSDRVWLDLPRDDVTFAGPRGDPAWADLPLNPTQLLIAFLADPAPLRSEAQDELLSVSGEHYRIEGGDWTLDVDRATQLPIRLHHSWPEPHELVWSEWAIRKGAARPHRTELTFPERDLVFELRLARFDAGLGLSDDLFQFAPEESRDLLQPVDAVDWWAQITARGQSDGL